MDSESGRGGDDPSFKNPAELALEIYRLLSPHPSETRLRAVQSAMTSLGETAVPPKESGVKGTIGSTLIAGDFEELHLGPRAAKWAQKNSITRAMLEEVFHFLNDHVEISASSVPGGSRREMTVNCYLLTGLRSLLADDVPTFDDSAAIYECKRTAAYDKNNHTANRQSIGNRMSGTRPKFTLTGPGETAAAELVKQMTAVRNA